MWQIFLDRMMSRLIEALLSGYITLQGLIAMRVTGEPLELDTDLIAQSLQSQLATRITHTTKTLKREVGRKIVSWYNSPGMTNQDIIKQLQPTFGAARASLISRTEITRLDALVQEDTARQLGITQWWWMTKRDQLVCKRPINGPDGKRYNGCRDLHGKVFNIGDKMPPDGSHIGCRCKAILISKPKPSVNDTPIVDISHLIKADFEESEHPRDKDGKFAPKGTGVKGIDKERSEAYDSQEEALQAAENHLGNGRPVATYKVKQPKLVTDISREISSWRTPKWLNDESRYKDMAKQVFENRLATDVKDEGKGRSVDEYREELFTKFHSMVDNQPLRIRVRIQHIEVLLSEDEERYKTQFETGVSGGLLDNSRRSQAELEGLNIPEHIDARYRPTYGYINDTMGDPSHYGKVGFILNESVKKRATITLDDSLRGMGIGYLPIPFNQIVPGRAANDPEELMYVGACIGNKTHTIRKGKVPSWSYIEAQIQGGWHMGEVTGAVFYKDCFKSDGTLEPEYAKLEAKLKDRGIKVEYNANKE